MPRSGVPVKTGKEKSVIPTHTNNFLAECVDLYSTATSVLCDVVPVPKESVPHPLHSSVDPVFPAVEADSLLQLSLHLLNTQLTVTKPF